MSEDYRDHLLSPLEQFVRDYLETAGGAWEEIEPQVYDVVLADSAAVLRLTFDPEALPDHPGSQLASYGTPLVDGLLNDALKRGRSARFHRVGLNLRPHNLAGRLRKALQLGEGLELAVERVRALSFTQSVYWFRAEFVSDQREQVVVPVAIDLHYDREVRHLEELLDPAGLAEEPAEALPPARRESLTAGYATAYEQGLRTIATLANLRARDLNQRRDTQIERMTRYYADLREELEEQARRARNPDEAGARLAERRAAIDREEQLRVAELRQKSELRVQVGLLQVLQVEQPKLLARTKVAGEKTQPLDLEAVWDPLMESVEAPACPVCRRPTFAFERGKDGKVACPACAARATAGRGGR